MMHTTLAPEAGPTRAPATARDAREQVVAELYDRGVIDARQVSKASIKLKLDPRKLALALGYDSVSEFVTEFVQVNPEPTLSDEEERAGWSTWSYDDMTTLVDLHYRQGLPAAEVAARMQLNNPARTYKSVKSFLRRTFDQGNTVDKYVWDLLLDGNAAEDIAEAGYNSWRVEFADMLMRLKRFCSTIKGAPDPVIRFRE